MKTIHYCIGLPRSGSTLLMNILSQNPSIYTTGTCPLPYFVDALRNISNQVSEFIAMDTDQLDRSYSNFIVKGCQGWYDAMTIKSTVISKSRVWDQELRTLFHIYPDPKFIVCLRDPRDIICSFEQLLNRYPHINISYNECSFEHIPFEERIKEYCTGGSNMGRPLALLPHVYEYMQRYPNNFFLFRFEDFCRDPHTSLSTIYRWLGMEQYVHDLNTIPSQAYFEHDAVYRALVSHKTRAEFKPIEPHWPKYFNAEQNQNILHNLRWFYELFYPEYL